MKKLIDFSLDNRFLVLVLVLLLIGAGLQAMLSLPIDAVPDITPNQVQILTNSPGLSPLEIEQSVTFPVETAMSGLPGIERIRSVSRFGLSLVSVYFEEEMDIYFCRRLVMERMPQAREAIPPGYGTPEMGPISTGLGEIYQFEVKGEGYSLMELRSILDWDIAFKLRSVPGVIEVNSFGGELKTYEVQIAPEKLISYSIPISSVFEALEANNANAGGAYIVKNQEQYLIRGEGLIGGLEDIEDIVLSAGKGGTPIYIRNVADVRVAPMVRQGAVTRDGQGEVVTGVIMMLIGENSRTVINRVKVEIEEIQNSLPPGVTIEPFYDRTELVRETINTVIKNLSEGGLLVVIVLLLLLGSLRGGLIVASAIPLSMLFAFIGMRQLGLSGNLMSLGAIDFGLIVDGSVVMVENIVRRFSKHSAPVQDRLQVVRDSANEVARPITFAVGIIIIVYLPILTLRGVEGKMFRPMAVTVVLALVGSLILSVTLMPVLASFVFRGRMRDKETLLIRLGKKL
jgi:cobalt-zinc-cadmium resistance protein CzcA